MPNPSSSGQSGEPSSARGAGGEYPPRSERDLARYGYAGQGYPIYGEPRGAPPREREPDPQREIDNPQREIERRRPGLFGAASTAYAFGYTTSLRPKERIRGGHAGKGPKDYVRSDERIREDVCDRLSDDDEVDARDIAVSVTDGDVVLQGTVPDRHEKRRAEMIAFSVRGAVDVHNRLRVKKGLLREIGDRLTGDEAAHHGHHGSGTR
jgi:hypothetical protein